MSRYLVEQTAKALRDRAAHAAEFGEVFPTEYELVEDLVVSRTTVREAISRLEAEGVLKRRHGTTATINAAALEIAGQFAGNDTESRLSAGGSTPISAVLERGPCLIDDVVAQMLQARPGDPAWRVVRTWTLDGRCVVAEIEHLLLPTWPMTIESPNAPTADIVEELYSEAVQWVVETADAEAADEKSADLLSIEPNLPVLVRNGLLISSTGRRVAHICTVQLPGVAPIGSVTTILDRAKTT